MKRLILSFLILFLLVNTFAIAQSKTFTGRVIYKSNEYIEVKYGKKEKIFYINNESVFYKNNEKVPIDQIEICQIVKITYSIIDKKMYILQCNIIKESDCK